MGKPNVDQCDVTSFAMAICCHSNLNIVSVSRRGDLSHIAVVIRGVAETSHVLVWIGEPTV